MYQTQSYENAAQNSTIAAPWVSTPNQQQFMAGGDWAIVHSPTMSSLEIAELTGKNHADVMRDIRKMLGELEAVDQSKFADTYTDSLQRVQPCYKLPRRETDILLTGYSIPMRAVVIDRWHELEAEYKVGSLALPNSLSGALNLACVLAYKVETLEQQLTEDAEKVDFYNKVYECDNLLNPTKASKLLDTGRTHFLEYLRDHKILMSRPHQQNMPYQRYLDAGYFEVKLGMYKNAKTGVVELKALPLLTGKGFTWLQKYIAMNGRDGL
ncbi:phage antirepressor protein [Pseudomonas plecoglossicida]|jgi:phage antirepressor YoqD-like protein|uniref:Phage antirepressor protein n=1 Tax=Pseudomonas plecoglossicida TaxID=70775 RepID=A0A2A3MAT2_PSEDL|nr:phage regulatory protein/antirepressor Ant [Pseudomonas plecoglossicida]PBJ96901.1 phage antirepressor protein [Pseudomonas plecoglossicida]